MNAYSKDLRLRVLAAVDRGIPYAEIVRLFGVSLATVGRWLRRRREAGNVVAPMPSPGRTPSICRTAKERRALLTEGAPVRVDFRLTSEAYPRLSLKARKRRSQLSMLLSESGAEQVISASIRTDYLASVQSTKTMS
jgi:transposase